MDQPQNQKAIKALKELKAFVSKNKRRDWSEYDDDFLDTYSMPCDRLFLKIDQMIKDLEDET